MESPCLELFKRHLDLVLRDVVYWFRAYNGNPGERLDWIILEVSSNLDSVVTAYFGILAVFQISFIQL